MTTLDFAGSYPSVGIHRNNSGELLHLPGLFFVKKYSPYDHITNVGRGYTQPQTTRTTLDIQRIYERQLLGDSLISSCVFVRCDDIAIYMYTAGGVNDIVRSRAMARFVNLLYTYAKDVSNQNLVPSFLYQKAVRGELLT